MCSPNGADKLSLRLVFGRYEPNAPTLLPALVGTLELIAVSTVIAIPIGIATAVFLTEYTNRRGPLVRLITVATETLSGIPSIVYGLFGYLVFVVALDWGYSMLAGGITLAIMILPVIVRSTIESDSGSDAPCTETNAKQKRKEHPMKLTAKDCNLYYGSFHALKNIRIEIPEKTDHRPDRSLRLRKIDLFEELQPHERLGGGLSDRGRISGRRQRHLRKKDRRDPAAQGRRCS